MPEEQMEQYTLPALAAAPRKLEEVILYVARQCEADPMYSKTKLNKILFYADFHHYLEHGRSITESVYEKWPFGPVPRGMPEVLATMESRCLLAIQRRKFHGHVQQRPVALRDADYDYLAGSEVHMLDYVIRELAPRNASEVSELSHQFIGWQCVGDREEIPYEMALLDLDPPDDQVLPVMRELVAAGR
jgi:uncharacterized phage-associated protein